MLATEERFFADLVNKESGIVLGDDKGYLLQSRLSPIVREMGYSSIKDLYDNVHGRITPDLRQRVVEALTTNETLFFRDLTPFKILEEKFIPEFRKQTSKPVKIWCAACSTGQEPYSVVMTFLEHWPGLTPRDLQIVATDLDTQVLDRAKQGNYSQIEVNRGLPVRLMAKYFQQNGMQYELSPKVRSFVTWKELNLARRFFMPGPFDLIFCRNVLIYFDLAMKKEILDQMSKLLKKTGKLFLGSTESAIGVTDTIKPIMTGRGGTYYVLPDAEE